jgi:hypothetical protein
MALEPLGSERFFNLMAALKKAGAEELFAIKAESWMDKSARLLNLEPGEATVGYAQGLSDATDGLNLALIAKLEAAIASEPAARVTGHLQALPVTKKDTDLHTISAILINDAEMFRQVNDEYVGLQPTWNRFYDDYRRNPLRTLWQKVDPGEADRRKLFQAISSIASGDQHPDLADYQTELDAAHFEFSEGRTEQLAERFIRICNAILKSTPPPPPGGGDSGEEGDEGEGEEGSTPGTPDWRKLGEYLEKQKNGADAKTPKKLDKQDFRAPASKVDIDKLKELQELQADIIFPDGDLSDAYLYFKPLVPTGASTVYQAHVSTMAKYIDRLRRIIEEYYRVKTITETGLKTGRVDAGRIHRLNYGVSTIFKRHTVDSVGHAEVIVILDESGSMSAGTYGSPLPKAKIPPGINTNNYSNEKTLLGKELPGQNNNNRVSVAMRMALALLEVSRQLPGFRVRVANYTAVLPGLLGHLSSAAETVSSKHGWRLAPIVREVASSEHPHGVVLTGAYAENADYQAMHWALDQLKNSRAPQRAVIYLADALIYDRDDKFQKLINRANSQGITIYLMNLSGDVVDKGSMLAKLPQHKVDNFDDMLVATKHFLNRMVMQLA